jgi:hypothetical protein
VLGSLAAYRRASPSAVTPAHHLLARFDGERAPPQAVLMPRGFAPRGTSRLSVDRIAWWIASRSCVSVAMRISFARPSA